MQACIKVDAILQEMKSAAVNTWSYEHIVYAELQDTLMMSSCMFCADVCCSLYYCSVIKKVI